MMIPMNMADKNTPQISQYLHRGGFSGAVLDLCPESARDLAPGAFACVEEDGAVSGDSDEV